MRHAVLLVLVVALAFSTEWVYRTLLRPVDQPTPRMDALAAHFNAHGLKGHQYAVRHGYRHSQMSAAAAFEIEGFPLPVSIAECPDEVSAQACLHAVRANPKLVRPARNGLLVMHLPMWGDGSAPMANKVQHLFSTFQYGADKRP